MARIWLDARNVKFADTESAFWEATDRLKNWIGAY